MPWKFHRSTAVPVMLSDLDKAKTRVRVLGKILQKSERGLILDDGTSQKEIIVEKDIADSLEVGELIRIFARILDGENGLELHSELIQDMSRLDEELYRKAVLKNY